MEQLLVSIILAIFFVVFISVALFVGHEVVYKDTNLSLTRKFKERSEARKKARKDSQYRDGYCWAAGTLLMGESSPCALEALIWSDDKGPFDFGVEDAIERLVELGVVEDNRV